MSGNRDLDELPSLHHPSPVYLRQFRVLPPHLAAICWLSAIWLWRFQWVRNDVRFGLQRLEVMARIFPSEPDRDASQRNSTSRLDRGPRSLTAGQPPSEKGPSTRQTDGVQQSTASQARGNLLRHRQRHAARLWHSFPARLESMPQCQRWLTTWHRKIHGHGHGAHGWSIGYRGTWELRWCPDRVMFFEIEICGLISNHCRRTQLEH
ncbi:hypothetical protein B0H65DRAFT_309600 [Neurospora tetraspora]|uniref:Uncharacterized protein n=1 Tax=Neurospora tetraspora TaxID=94610 RepID=A0AAE0J6X2_9PEZI|nr:hypothetical protein B0H65DRAFT_309600 [Neurospora tetraspora]